MQLEMFSVPSPALLHAQENAPEWTEAEVFYLHYRVLEDAIEVLGQPQAGRSTKQEVLEWLTAPDWQQWKGKTVHGTEVPFSFQRVCRVLGYNAADLLEEILRDPQVAKCLSRLN